MKTKIILTSLIMLAMLAFVPQVLALSIEVSQAGQIHFYQGEVQGRNSNAASAQGQAAQAANAGNSAQANQVLPAEIRPALQDKSIRVRTENQGVAIEVANETQTGQDVTTSETIKSSELKMDVPAGKAAGSAQAGQAADRGNQPESALTYREQVQAERQARSEEMVQVRTKLHQEEQRLELESRGATARLMQGAQLNYDAETGLMTLITPSGNEHILNHLPDQALERMRQAGYLNADPTEVEIETDVDGEVYFVAPDQVEKRLFGLFPRRINTEVLLNDETGEVTEVPQAAETFLRELLNVFSF